MKVLLLYPEFPDTFWSFKHAVKFIRKKVSLLPLGLLTAAALGALAAYAKQAIRDKLLEHEQYIVQHGENLPEIQNWTWSISSRQRAASSHER